MTTTDLSLLENPEVKLTKKEREELQRQYYLMQKQAGAIGQLVRQITLFEGKKGRGKTLAAVAVAYQMKEFFDMPVTIVGSSMDLVKETFGDYEFLDERDFINELDKMTKITKQTEDSEIGDAVEVLLERMGIKITNSLLVFDEAYKFFDSRSPSDKLVKVFGYFVAQSRHYKSTIILVSPNRDMIDKRVRRQIDWVGRCYTNHKNHVTTVRLTGGVESFRLKIFGPNYWDMYNTHSLLGFRAKHLTGIET
jgi:SpoVK/Ycf46/Vps4 family AAA+-type ATPase